MAAVHPASDPQTWHVGLLGYGEVGRILAEDLCARGMALSTYDLKLDGPEDRPLREHALRHGVHLCTSHAALAERAALIVSAVTASQTVAAARACTTAISRGTFFLDLNSASPGSKREAAAALEAAGARYVEGAVMSSVPPYRIAVPMLLGGPHAAVLQPSLRRLGFASEVADARFGIASATKLCRSVMIKGLEAMVIESFVAARALGVEDALLASLHETFPGIDWERQGTYCFARVIAHGRRRAEEMREAAHTVREVGLEAWSAAGTAERQAWVAELAEAGVLGTGDSADWRSDADRILAHLKDGR